MTPQTEFLGIIDSLYTEASQMRDIMSDVLIALNELNHGPVVQTYAHNIKHQMEYADLAMTAAANAHELERKNRRSCAETQIAVYKVILNEINKLNEKLEEQK